MILLAIYYLKPSFLYKITGGQIPDAAENIKPTGGR